MRMSMATRFKCYDVVRSNHSISVLLVCISCTEQLLFSDHPSFLLVNVFVPDLPMATSSGTIHPTVSSGTITSTATAGSSAVTSCSTTAPTVTFASLMSAVEASVSRQVESAVAHALGEPTVLSARSLAPLTPATLSSSTTSSATLSGMSFCCICMCKELLSYPPICPSGVVACITLAPTLKSRTNFSSWISAPLF